MEKRGKGKTDDELGVEIKMGASDGRSDKRKSLEICKRKKKQKMF